MKKGIIFLGAILFIFSLIQFSFAQISDSLIETIQKTIKEKGLSWTAGQTKISRMSDSEFKAMLGGFLPRPDSPESPRAGIEKIEAAQLPSYFSWGNYNGHDWMTSVKDQGHCGCCWGFATAGAFEARERIRLNQYDWPIDVSEQNMVSCWKGDCEGWQMESVLNHFKYDGCPDEACFPYVSGTGYVPPCNNRCTDWLSHAYFVGNWGRYNSPNVSVIKNEIQNHGPVVVRMEVYDDFRTYQGGVYVHAIGDSSEGHVVVFYGWDDANNCWFGKNSWGTDIDWGETGPDGTKGWFRIRMGMDEVGCEDFMWYLDPAQQPAYDITLVPIFQGCWSDSVVYWLKTLVYYHGTTECAAEGALELQIQGCPTAYFTEKGTQTDTVGLNGANCDVGQYWPHICNKNQSCTATLASRVQGYEWHYQQLYLGSSCPPPVPPIYTVTGAYETDKAERSAVFNREGTKMAFLGNSSVEIYQLNPFKALCEGPGTSNYALDFSPIGDSLIVTRWNGTSDFELIDSSCNGLPNWPRDWSQSAYSLDWQPNGDAIAYDLTNTGQKYKVYVRGLGGAYNTELTDIPSTYEVLTVQWSPSGEYLAATTKNPGSVYVWKYNGGGSFTFIGSNNTGIVNKFGLAWSSGGYFVVAGQYQTSSGLDNVIRYRVTSGVLTRVNSFIANTNGQAIYSVAFSPDGSKIVLAGQSNGTYPFVRIFDVSTGAQVADLVTSMGAGIAGASVDWSINNYILAKVQDQVNLFTPFDVTPPNMAIVYPPSNFATFYDTVTVQGTIRDDYSLDSAFYRINGESYITIPFDPDWKFSFVAPLKPDTNKIEFRLMDKMANVSNSSLTVMSRMTGDANGDGKVTVSDVVYLVSYLFKGGPPPNPIRVGDANCDGKVTVADVVYLVSYLFKGGPLPIC